MYYFKFTIGTNNDGSRVSYSPGWFGSMRKCPKNVTVLLYDDKQGYGIASAEDTFIPPEVEQIKEAEALKLVDASNGEQVFKGKSITDRWKVGAFSKISTISYHCCVCGSDNVRVDTTNSTFICSNGHETKVS